MPAGLLKTEPTSPRLRNLLIIVGVLFVIFVFMFVLFMFSDVAIF
jgi:hypothetical protein